MQTLSISLYIKLKKWHNRFKSDIIHWCQRFVSFKSEQLSNISPTLMVHYDQIHNKDPHKIEIKTFDMISWNFIHHQSRWKQASPPSNIDIWHVSHDKNHTVW